MGDQWTAGARAASGRLPIKAVQTLERIAEALDVDVEEPIPQSCEAGALRRSGCAGSAIVHGYRRGPPHSCMTISTSNGPGHSC